MGCLSCNKIMCYDAIHNLKLSNCVRVMRSNSYRGDAGWATEVWKKCQALLRFSPFAFASSELEEPFMDYLKEMLRSTTTLSCCISLVVTGAHIAKRDDSISTCVCSTWSIVD